MLSAVATAAKTTAPQPHHAKVEKVLVRWFSIYNNQMADHAAGK
jgi:hypothetical protein